MSFSRPACPSSSQTISTNCKAWTKQALRWARRRTYLDKGAEWRSTTSTCFKLQKRGSPRFRCATSLELVDLRRPVKNSWRFSKEGRDLDQESMKSMETCNQESPWEAHSDPIPLLKHCKIKSKEGHLTVDVVQACRALARIGLTILLMTHSLKVREVVASQVPTRSSWTPSASSRCKNNQVRKKLKEPSPKSEVLRTFRTGWDLNLSRSTRRA